MAKHLINGFVVYRTASYYTEEERIHWTRHDPRENEFMRTKEVVICEQAIEVEAPDDFDPRPTMIEALRAEQQKVRAEMAARIKQIDDRINSLLAIEMSA